MGEKIDEIASDADTIIEQLEFQVKLSQAQRITVDVLISNKGRRPMALRPLALLKLSVTAINDPSRTETVPIRLERSESDEIWVVSGGESMLLSFYSTLSLSAIVSNWDSLFGGEDWSTSEAFEDSRLFRLWTSSTPSLKATAVLARAGRDPEDAKAGESPYVVVGLSAREAIFESLEK